MQPLSPASRFRRSRRLGRATSCVRSTIRMRPEIRVNIALRAASPAARRVRRARDRARALSPSRGDRRDRGPARPRRARSRGRRFRARAARSDRVSEFFAGIDGGQSSTIAVIGDETRQASSDAATAGPADEIGAGAGSTRLRDALRDALADALPRCGPSDEAHDRGDRRRSQRIRRPRLRRAAEARGATRSC